MVHILDLGFQNTPQSIAAFLIETSVGPVLIETGPHSTLPALEAGLAQKGYQLKDIQHVFLTHIHFDHAGAAWVFAEHGANVYLHPFGEKHMADPTRLYNSAKMIYKDMMEVLWGQLKPIPKSLLHTAAHGEKFLIGDTEIVAWHTPGHAVHHIAWQVGTHLIAGDVAGVKIGPGMVVIPCPPPDINIEHWKNSIDIIARLDLEAVYLVHFGKVTDLASHFKDLRYILQDWADWMRPHYEAGTDPNVITPQFVAYVRQQLIDYGTPEEYLDAYEIANPSYMSVRGLLRYWRKKLEIK